TRRAAAGGGTEVPERLPADAPDLLVDAGGPGAHLPVHPVASPAGIDDADALPDGVEDLAGLLPEQRLLQRTKIAGVTEDAGEATLPELSDGILDVAGTHKLALAGHAL